MALSKTGTGPTSPWEFYNSGGDYLERSISATVTFNQSTGAITGGSITRDAGCLYVTIVIGDPASPSRSIDVSGIEGTRSFTAGQLAARGISNISDILSFGQITALQA
ncbi:hypothetical protein ACQP1P_38570 [Dactylosporangium sp. CA-052675]|uniref:hypothetical protein n=1 Tax=Dactylosporangium sp. CA-052675 TaxID=3239927 RepID=UPI003D8E1C20